MNITLTSEERDALYDQVVASLPGIDAVWRAVEAEDFEAADFHGQGYSDSLRLVLDDLRWGDGPGGAIELRTPADVLRRVFERLRDVAECERANEPQELVEARRGEEQTRLVMQACSRVLADLEGKADAGG